jgi:Major capsid protein Gp23
MNLVNSLLQESAQNAYGTTLSVSQRLVKKWGKSGLLKNLNEHDSRTMAMILENQSKQLVIETSAATGGVSNGATFTAGAGEQWAGVALPLVRKIFGQLASKEFVSVQPMNLPAGLVFYLDFQYGTTSPQGFTAGQSMYGTKNSTDFGNAAAGGLYGAGTFGYSLNVFSASAPSASVSTGSGVTFADVNFDAYQSASIASQGTTNTLASSTLVKIAIANFTKVAPAFNTYGVRSFELSGSGLTAASTANQYTTYNPATDTATFIYSGSALSSANYNLLTGSAFTVFYNKQTDFNAIGDFEDRTSTQGISVPNAYSPTSISIPEVNVQMVSQTISAKTRKLKAQWTPEFAQDLNAYHSLDAEAELTGILSEYITLEIDLEVLDMLIQKAPTVDFWSAKVGNQINATNTAFNSNTAGVFYNQMTWFQTIGIKLQKLSNIIHQKTLRGGANFMVVSPAVATILESIPGFAADTDGAADTMKYAFGVQKIGSLNSRYKVYKNPYMLENVVLLGFRGNQFLECGAVYAPYVPLIMTPLVYDPNTFTPRKGIMTRYAMTMVRPEFYANLFVSDLNIV